MKNIYVTIIDENKINQKALFLMINTLLLTNLKLLSKLYIVCPQYLSNHSVYKILRSNGINVFLYDFKPTDDKYYIKFLLCDFIKQFKNKFEVITYIDPDHIFLSELNSITPNYNEVILSSESNELLSEYFSKYTYENNHFINYNASYMSAKISTWSKIIYKWKDNYFKLNNQVSNRFREEIAFSISLMETKTKIIQLPVDIQSNFKVFDENCVMFHYGGEYSGALNIKALLRDGEIISHTWIKNNYDNAIDYIERWFWNSLQNVLKDTMK